MTHPASLPESSFVPVTTRRLARPELLWQDEGAAALGFDPERIYCSPVPGDAPEAYADETRVEWADRYGGIGLGAAGGSGRCATYGGLQTKGVGVSPLVAHDADVHHSSGAQTAPCALVEALFSRVFQAALPFGAVPTLAVVLAHRPDGGERLTSSARALTFRPFVLRPAHFMRNVLNQQQREPQGASAPGLTRDAHRVVRALQQLPQGLQAALGLPLTDAAETIDAGLRELTRRLAWQFAANFAKRLPHGSVSCSNISLSGQFLDYGMAHCLPTYRRPTDALQDPWTENQRALQTVVLLRQQLDKYVPGLRAAAIVSADELSGLYAAVLQQRLGIEMAKMAGLTEDLALVCPAQLLADWLQAMRAVWRHGGREPLVPNEANVAWRPQPVDPQRPDLNRILAAAAPWGEAALMDEAIAPLLADADLRGRLVRAAVAVRQALRPTLGDSAGALDGYLAIQASRKNAVLPELERDSWFRIAATTQMLDEDFRPAAVRALLDGVLQRASHALADLAPGLPGRTGTAQIQELAQGVRLPAENRLQTLTVVPRRLRSEHPPRRLPPIDRRHDECDLQQGERDAGRPVPGALGISPQGVRR
jgi:hypothetical protein